MSRILTLARISAIIWSGGWFCGCVHGWLLALAGVVRRRGNRRVRLRKTDREKQVWPQLSLSALAGGEF